VIEVLLVGVEVVVVSGVVVDVVEVDVLDVDVVVDDVESGDVGGSEGGGPVGPPRGGGAPTCEPGPASTYTASPRRTRLGKYSEMCIGMRTQPCDAGYVGTDGEPCTATPLPVKYTGL
jgi:hypothetical protein